MSLKRARGDLDDRRSSGSGKEGKALTSLGKTLYTLV